MTANNALEYDPQKNTITLQGDWDIASLPSLKQSIKSVNLSSANRLIINGDSIKKMDSAGAWLLNQWQNQLKKNNVTVSFKNFSDAHQALLDLINSTLKEEIEIPEPPRISWIQQVGLTTYQQFNELLQFLSFIGKLTFEALRISSHPTHFRIPAIASTIYRNGYQALPIIALLSFMIGVVITYQMGLQLKNYGANIFIVDLLGLSILREFGPLLTAIMVAGRTGSAFTAQLGMMKLNQEIDALDTLGVTPAEVLLLPRIIGLFIALPLLTVWANIFGVFGGMVMANNMLGITWYDFLHRFPTVIPLRALLIGIGKTPIFALLIASIGCYEGMQVEQTADSVGKNTTRSVVLSIFFIIVADAIFSIIFSKLKL